MSSIRLCAAVWLLTVMHCRLSAWRRRDDRKNRRGGSSSGRITAGQPWIRFTWVPSLSLCGIVLFCVLCCVLSCSAMHLSHRCSIKWHHLQTFTKEAPNVWSCWPIIITGAWAGCIFCWQKKEEHWLLVVNIRGSMAGDIMLTSDWPRLPIQTCWVEFLLMQKENFVGNFRLIITLVTEHCISIKFGNLRKADFKEESWCNGDLSVPSMGQTPNPSMLHLSHHYYIINSVFFYAHIFQTPHTQFVTQNSF